jgi:hypothetical protein
MISVFLCVVSYCSSTATGKNPFALQVNNNNNISYAALLRIRVGRECVMPWSPVFCEPGQRLEQKQSAYLVDSLKKSNSSEWKVPWSWPANETFTMSRGEFSKLRNDWKFHPRPVKLIAVCHRSMTVHNSCLFTLCSCPAPTIGVTSAMGTRRCPPLPIQSTSVGFPQSPPGEVPSNHTKHGAFITPRAC